MNEGMMRAYRAARRLMEEELPLQERELLQGVSESDIVVVTGCYDRVEDVLRLSELRFLLVKPEDVAGLALEPRQLLIVNCPGEVGPGGVEVIRSFVERGGSLMTTDWALLNVLEPAFPGLVEFSQKPTRDDVVRVEIRCSDHPLLEGMFHEGTDPLWWLEGASYPIRILDRERVQVLLTSSELEAKYGEAPVAVSFRYGEGEVLHMISHYYLQRSELRTERHNANWKEYATEVGFGGLPCLVAPELADLKVGEVEAAHKSLRLMTNLIVDKQRRNRDR
jgi:hypothetical protein